MAVKPDAAPLANTEAAAHRRWLITIVITVVFGGFGAVMAYLSYANSHKPAAQSPTMSRPSDSSGSSPSSAPATPPTVAPPATESTSGGSHKGKPDKDK